MAESSKDGLMRRMLKSAATPILASIASAGSAYLTRKAAALAQEKVLPKIREKGGASAAAKETFENVAGKVAGPAEETLSALAEKVRGDDTNDAKSRERARRGREQRRRQRRRTLDQSGSS